MFSNDSGDKGEADPGSFKLLGSVQTLEDAKQSIDIFHVETDAIIANINNILIVHVIRSDYYFGPIIRTGIFECIPKYILKHLLDQVDIVPHFAKFSNVPFNFSLVGLGVLAGHDLFYDHFQIYVLVIVVLLGDTEQGLASFNHLPVCREIWRCNAVDISRVSADIARRPEKSSACTSVKP